MTNTIQITPRYHEVDSMGYVYHGNYIGYCHQARTEFMRGLSISDRVLEEKGILLPVIDFKLKYLMPAHYDEPLWVIAKIDQLTPTRVKFGFSIKNRSNRLVCSAQSTIVFVNGQTRKPLKIPVDIANLLKSSTKKEVIP